MEQSALLVVDVQEKLWPHMHNAQALLDRTGVLINGFVMLNRPIIVTEQYRKGLGLTVPPLAAKLHGATVFEKLRFSGCIEPVQQALADCGASCVVVCGIEAHVCVLQTCLDLADAGLTTAVALDAIGSRRAIDQTAAVDRMMQAGILPTTAESALLELLHEAGTERFRAILPLIR
ncbi:MAG: isochorismatase family protein [Phycisphaeraceae bacterium]|nr:isochorismatase family protein [Phycisphaeraceae bacterium]